MSDTIYRQDAIEAVWKPQVKPNELIFDALKRAIESEINNIPSADRPTWLKTEIVEEYDGLHPDGITKVKSNATKREKEMFEYGYKCGMNDSDRPQGEWIDAEIPLESGGSMPIQVCNLCKTFYPLAYTGGGHRFCPNCGAMMKGTGDE